MRISSGILGTVDISDRAGRDLGGVDPLTYAQGIDQWTGRFSWDVVSAGAGLLLYASGDQPAGLYMVHFVLSGTVTITYAIGTRSAANVDNTAEYNVQSESSAPVNFWSLFNLALNEEVIIRTIDANAGRTRGGGVSWRLRA